MLGANMQEYDTLKQLVTEAEDDVQKAIGGNKAAGTRVRKKMQEIKSAAQEVRKKILEGRDIEPGAPASSEADTAD
jgi:cytidylate kinase